MGSSRYPGKMLENLAGKPVLYHCLDRLKTLPASCKLVLLTSNRPQDDALVQLAEQMSIESIRGDEQDVLSRFISAMEQFPADYLVRVCGDCPLVDPWLIEQMIAALKTGNADMIRAVKGREWADCGIDPISASAFWRLVDIAAADPEAGKIIKEHVTGYLDLAKPDWVKRAPLSLPDQRRLPGLSSSTRLSIDTPADLSFIQALYERSAAGPGQLSMIEALELLRKEPELLDINRHIQQKKAAAVTYHVLMVTEGSKRLGLGHIKRSLILGQYLRDHLGVGVSMAVNAAARKLVKESGFPVLNLPAPGKRSRFLYDWLARPETLCDGIIFDLFEGQTRLSDFPPASKRAGGNQPLIALIDDGSARNLDADLSFLPPHAATPQAGAHTNILQGWEWMVLPACFNRTPEPAKPEKNTGKNILIALGGSDPEGRMFKILDYLLALKDAVTAQLSCRIILGPAIGQTARSLIYSRLDTNKSWLMLEDSPPSIAPFLHWADLLICRYGITLYEGLAFGCSVASFPGNNQDREHFNKLAQDGWIKPLPEDYFSDDYFSDDGFDLGHDQKLLSLLNTPPHSRHPLTKEQGGTHLTERIYKSLEQRQQSEL